MSKQNMRLHFYDDLVADRKKVHRTQNDEICGIYGHDCKYLSATRENIDKLMGEDNTESFEQAYDIVVIIEGLENFNTGEDMYAKFGFVQTFSSTLYIDMERFTNMTSLSAPAIGDVIYIPFFSKWFKITYVNSREQFYVDEQSYIFKMEVKQWEYSHETIDTGDDEVDDNKPSTTGQTDADADAVEEYATQNSLITGFSDLLED